MPRIRLVLAAIGTLALAACSQIVDLPDAPEGTSAECEAVAGELPSEVGADPTLDRRESSAAGSAAYGNPAVITVRCGLPSPAPSTERCLTVGDVDWLVLGQEDEIWTLVSYGRAPATEVVIDTSAMSALDVLDAVSPAVALTEKTGSCT